MEARQSRQDKIVGARCFVLRLDLTRQLDWHRDSERDVVCMDNLDQARLL